MKQLNPFAILATACVATMTGCAPDPIADVPDLPGATMDVDSEDLWTFYDELDPGSVYDLENGCGEVIQAPIDGDPSDMSMVARVQGCTKEGEITVRWILERERQADRGSFGGAFHDLEHARRLRGHFQANDLGVYFSHASSEGYQVTVHGMVSFPDAESPSPFGDERPYFQGLFVMQ